MRRIILCIALMCAVAASVLGQASSSKYQPGTIMAVKDHLDPNDSTKRYDISIKVGHTMYVVLYTPPPGAYGFQYSAGQDLLVSVGTNTITYNDLLGNSRKVPIVSRSPVSAKSVR
jgi:hypothetical protein